MDGQKKRYGLGASLPIVVKLTMELILAALVPLGIAIWLTSSKSSAALENAARLNETLLANVTATQLDQLLIDTTRAVDMASRDDTIIEALDTPDDHKEIRIFDAVSRRVHSAVDTNPDIASMFVINRLGIGIASSNDKHIGMDFNFREYAKEALAGHAYISEYTVGKVSGDAGVYISHPVFKRASGTTSTTQPIGVVVIKLNGDSIDRLVSAVQVGELGYGILSDHHGVVISSPHEGERFHSFAVLDDQTVKEINPQLRYSLESVPSLDTPELMSYLSTSQTRGSAMFTRPAAMGTGSRASWIAGYSTLTERPWKLFVIQPTSQFEEATNSLLRQQGYVGLGLSGIALIVAILRARSVTTPVIELTQTARKLAGGDFKARAAQYSNDEVGQLAKTFNDMVPQLQNRVELQRTIELAKQVQQNLLPQKAPVLRGLDVAGRSEYCDSTGGDYYDFVESIDLPDQQSLIAIGDVTGHGLGAALLMCTARAALRSSALGTSSLGVLMSRINTVLTQDAIDDMYMTLTLMVIDVEKGTIRYACAAHDPICILEPGATEFKELAEGSVPLGAVPGLDYEEYHFEGLKPGTLLFIGTDGIWEARNHAGEMFGKERMLEAVLKNAGKSSKQIGLAVEQALYDYLQKVRIQDDVTYVVVKVLL